MYMYTWLSSPWSRDKTDEDKLAKAWVREWSWSTGNGHLRLLCWSECEDFDLIISDFLVCLSLGLSHYQHILATCCLHMASFLFLSVSILPLALEESAISRTTIHASGRPNPHWTRTRNASMISWFQALLGFLMSEEQQSSFLVCFDSRQQDSWSDVCNLVFLVKWSCCHIPSYIFEWRVNLLNEPACRLVKSLVTVLKWDHRGYHTK